MGYQAHGIFIRVLIRLLGLPQVRVHAQELAGLQVVVAPDQVTGPARVGVGTREPEGRVAGEATRGLRIAAGAVVDRRSLEIRRRSRPRAPTRGYRQPGGRPRRQVHLLGQVPPPTKVEALARP